MKIKKTSLWVVVVVGVVALGFSSTGCKRGGGEAAGAPPGKAGGPGDKTRIAYPVEVEEVRVRSLVYTVNAVGSIEAFEKVQVTARVAGVVDRVLFAEGNFAEVGRVLVEIEPERYKLAVEAAQAAYEKALASKADAEAGLKRRQTVVGETPGLIPGEEIETWKTKVLVAASEVAQTKAALDQAKLNLRDAYVRAPFNGIIQTRTVQTGQYVQVGTVLATLVRRDPLLLRFKVPDRDAARIEVGKAANFRVREVDREFTSKIVHVAESADESSRMVDITAEIKESGEEILRPGSFAEVSVPVSGAREAPVVPQTAVRPSERGFLAYVVENGAAVERVLTLGMRTAEGLVEVTSGLSAGEVLVVRGAEALRDGVPVRIIGPEEEPSREPHRNLR
ncbi:MAG: efflux RND transporter periplasmic adaptor subunit [Candidatus Aminicenantales bacterium]